MTEEGELGNLDVELYRALLNEPGSTLGDVAPGVGVSSDELDKPAATLLEIGLITTENGAHFTAVNPSLAEMASLGAEELELNARRVAVEARRAAIRQVMPDWARAVRDQNPQPSVEVVTDPEAARNVLMYFAEHCEQEVLSVAPGRGPARIDPRTRTANLYSLGRGVATRLLYQHVALRDRATRAYCPPRPASRDSLSSRLYANRAWSRGWWRRSSSCGRRRRRSTRCSTISIQNQRSMRPGSRSCV